MDIIERQQSLADEIYGRMEDFPLLLAGGAPRDWYMGEEGDDLDFYIQLEGEEAELFPNRVKERLGIDIAPLGKNSEYGALMPGDEEVSRPLKEVYEGYFKGQTIQFMVLDVEPLDYVLNHFNVSTSEVWYKDGEIGNTWKFRLSIEEKILVANGYVKDGYFNKLYSKAHFRWFGCARSWNQFLASIGEREEANELEWPVEEDDGFIDF